AAKWEVISGRTLGGAEVDDVVLVAPMQQHRQSGRSQLQNSREFPAQLEIASLPFGYFFDLSSGATATLPINPIAGKQVEGPASGHHPSEPERPPLRAPQLFPSEFLEIFSPELQAYPSPGHRCPVAPSHGAVTLRHAPPGRRLPSDQWTRRTLAGCFERQNRL